jgi:hypothetical protein
MPEKTLIGVTFHFDDDTKQKVPVDALMNWQVAKAGGGGKKGGNRYNWVNEPECPEHGRWDVVQAGSNDNGSWDAFYSCTERDCNYRPGRDWVKNGNPAEDYVTAAESANDDSAIMDDLPF